MIQPFVQMASNYLLCITKHAPVRNAMTAFTLYKSKVKNHNQTFMEGHIPHSKGL